MLCWIGTPIGMTALVRAPLTQKLYSKPILSNAVISSQRKLIAIKIYYNLHLFIMLPNGEKCLQTVQMPQIRESLYKLQHFHRVKYI
jgi:hypothetical protein